MTNRSSPTPHHPSDPAATPDLRSLRLSMRTGDIAALLGISPRSVYRLRDAGKLPAPVQIGRLIRWDREVIDRWVDAGCPSMRTNRGGAR